MSDADHRAFLASLEKGERRNLQERRNLPGLVRIGIHLGTAIALGALIVARVPLWAALVPAQGAVLIFLFAPLHETSHKTAFRTPALNQWVGRLCGFVLFLPPVWFRCFHLAHHAATQDPKHDPELAAPKPASVSAYILHMSGLTVWRAQLSALVSAARGRCHDPFLAGDKRKKEAQREAKAMLVAYAALASASAASDNAMLLWGWILPVIIGQPLLRGFLLAEHAERPRVPNMLRNSRTTLTAAPVRLLAWNMPFHAEHHTLPSVPFHRLPELHRRLARWEPYREQGYLRFHLRFLRPLVRPRAPGG